MPPKSKAADVVDINFDFKKAVEEVVDGVLVNYCYQCGACAGDCPSTRYLPAFNPREIMLKVLYGMGEELVGPASPVWRCTNCYTCYERCPQNVKPVEIIIALKNLMARKGIYPEGVKVTDIVDAVMATGRTAPVTAQAAKRREELGLKPLANVDMDEVKKVVG